MNDDGTITLVINVFDQEEAHTLPFDTANLARLTDEIIKGSREAGFATTLMAETEIDVFSDGHSVKEMCAELTALAERIQRKISDDNLERIQRRNREEHID